MFERSVALDPANREAVGDLFDYYLGAPGFLGGGANKAEALAAQVAARDPAEGHYYQARLDDHRKEYDSAERHLRAAMELAPRQVGRVIALARYLAAHGRTKESDALFDQAAADCSGDPRVIYERASAYVKGGRNLDEARQAAAALPAGADYAQRSAEIRSAESCCGRSGPDVPLPKRCALVSRRFEPTSFGRF